MKKTYLFALIIILSSCSQKQTQHFSGQTFGTLYSVTYLGEYNPKLQHSVDSLLGNLSRTFSIFDTSSIIYKINNGENVLINDDIVSVMQLSKIISEETGGAFDYTIQPLVQLWGFGKDGIKHSVSDDTLQIMRQHIGYNLIDLQNGKILKKDSLLQLNFNAIAKGFAVDKVADLLVLNGIANCLVEIGGEVAARGNKNGKPWRVGIQTPCENADGQTDSFQSFDLPENRAVATSGNYRNYFEENGIRYTHILDPRTGKPERTNLLSVSVIAPDCATADAYATAFMVLGYEKASDILKKHPELEAWFIIATSDNDGFKVIKL